MNGFWIETWGCQMNVHDTEKMSGALEGAGWRRAGSAEEADLVLLNTCAIREKAAEKVFHELGRLRLLKRTRPELLLGVAGCVGSLEGEEIFRRAPHVDLVVGPRGIAGLPELVSAARARRRAIDVAHHPESVLFPWQAIRREAGSPHAYVTIIEGCNKGCTFCVVPATRGPEASRSLESVLEEVRALAGVGVREIEFLGQTVNAYRDPSGRRLSDLLRAVDAIAPIDGIARFRFTTSHPVHMTADLLRAMADVPRVIRHLHLPVQSGSDPVLARMKRGYSRAGYLEKIVAARRLMPDLTFSTDIIVGFPGETEEDFAATLSLVEEVGFDALYSFVYSERPGTDAAGMDGTVPFDVQAERLARLQARQGEIQAARLAALVGRQVEVLVDGPARFGDGLLSGRTHQGHIVNFPGAGARPGQIVRLVVERAGAHSLRGGWTGMPPDVPAVAGRPFLDGKSESPYNHS